jgi:hypothetical protein
LRGRWGGPFHQLEHNRTTGGRFLFQGPLYDKAVVEERPLYDKAVVQERPLYDKAVVPQKAVVRERPLSGKGRCTGAVVRKTPLSEKGRSTIPPKKLPEQLIKLSYLLYCD